MACGSNLPPWIVVEIRGVIGYDLAERPGKFLYFSAGTLWNTEAVHADDYDFAVRMFDCSSDHARMERFLCHADFSRRSPKSWITAG